MGKNARIVECVPNFSEGRDAAVIRQITDAVESVEGVALLNVDPGEATNRTVVTFVGEPEVVVEAAFRAVSTAGQVIDMRHHHGAHPRIGATDVLPLVPVSGITLNECAALARRLAERIAAELAIPCYCYEAAALRPERKNLAVCRKGEYEGIADRITNEEEKPDFGARPYDEGVARTGCTVVGARDFLIAVNFNLNTTSTRRANAVAFDVREKGRPKRTGNPITGPICRDADGKAIMIPGTLRCTKAIGWYIEEYGIAQVSMNMTDLGVTPLHVAFDEVCRAADRRGLRVTGTEIVGLVPESTLVEAGKYFLRKQRRSTGLPKDDIIDVAVRSMGLSDLRPFVVEEKVIERLMRNRVPKAAQSLVALTAEAFAQETSRESPAPGGGSVAAYIGALAASLGAMTANLASHKAGWDDRWDEFSAIAERGIALQEELLRLVDEDTAAFNEIMAAFALPKTTAEDKLRRRAAVQAATLHAAQVPLETMQTAAQVIDICREMAQKGLAATASDAGVGALAARAAVAGAALNVKINAAALDDKSRATELVTVANGIITEAETGEKEVMAIVNGKIATDSSAS